MDISIISRILVNSPRLIIPTIGSFLRTDAEAGYSLSNLSFSAFLKYDDQYLQGQIADLRGVSLPEAREELDRMVDFISREIDRGGCHIPGVGLLRRDEFGMVIFEPGRVGNAPSPEVETAVEPVGEAPAPAYAPPAESLADTPVNLSGGGWGSIGVAEIDDPSPQTVETENVPPHSHPDYSDYAQESTTDFTASDYSDFGYGPSTTTDYSADNSYDSLPMPEPEGVATGNDLGYVPTTPPEPDSTDGSNALGVAPGESSDPDPYPGGFAPRQEKRSMLGPILFTISVLIVLFLGACVADYFYFQRYVPQLVYDFTGMTPGLAPGAIASTAPAGVEASAPEVEAVPPPDPGPEPEPVPPPDVSPRPEPAAFAPTRAPSQGGERPSYNTAPLGHGTSSGGRVERHYPSPGEDSNYHIVLGSFEEPGNANRQRSYLSACGFNASIMDRPSGMHAVVIGSFRSSLEAQDALVSIRTKYPDAWICIQ